MFTWIKNGYSVARRPENKFFAALAGISIIFLIYLFLHEVLTWNWIRQSRLPPAELILDQDTAQVVERLVGMDRLMEVYERGAQDFVTCTICHSELPGEHRFGPSLHGVIGARIGQHLTHGAYPYETSVSAGPTRDPYRYSAAFHRLHAEGLIWSLPALWSFVYDQRSFVKDSRMPFLGLKSIGSENEAKTKVQSVIHYLAWTCKPGCGSDLKLVRLDIAALSETDLQEGSLWKAFRAQPYAHTCEVQTDEAQNLGTDPSLFVLPDFVLTDEFAPCTADTSQPASVSR